jgi:hypothetical protein
MRICNPYSCVLILSFRSADADADEGVPRTASFDKSHAIFLFLLGNTFKTIPYVE